MEFVYVVPRGELFPDRYPQGLLPFREGQDCPEAVNVGEGGVGEDSGAQVKQRAQAKQPAAVTEDDELDSRARFERVLAQSGFFVERARAECTPDWKQPIPYSVVTVGDRVLLLRRTRGGGEARLFDKLSIGVGGHINPVDLGQGAQDRSEVLFAAARRELEEELHVDGPFTIEPIGILNDDANAVGAVHVGLVLRIRVDGSVRVREEDQLEGRLVTTAELRELLDQGANFETWSELLVRHMDLLPAAPPDPNTDPVAAPGGSEPVAAAASTSPPA